MTVEDLIGPLNQVESKYAPSRLWVAGDLSIFAAGRLVSVVGARYPSTDAVRRTQRLVSELVKRDIAVLSGLALGVDTVAHVTAMERGGQTVAVLGTPLDQATPRSNACLQQSIINEHVAVSQFPPGAPVQRWYFTVRNRTMALLAPATVIVEAGEGSGTQHQGWEAIRLGRPLYFLKSAVDSTSVGWITEQMKYGAEVLMDENYKAILDTIPTRVHLPMDEVEETLPF